MYIIVPNSMTNVRVMTYSNENYYSNKSKYYNKWIHITLPSTLKINRYDVRI